MNKSDGKMRRLAALLSISLSMTAHAQEAVEDSIQRSGDDARSTDIIVYGRAIEQIGVARSGSQGTIGYKDFEDKPLSRVGELVENVPGVIATQHSGSGKANQYFLRGFNLDHGTDLAIFVDGLPVNKRTHGHGQGYLDVNFLIPELVERIDYRKGPYFSDVGDFSAAGTIKFKTYDRLAQPIVAATLGEFGYYRGLAAGSTKLGNGELLVGIEGLLSNGPWVLDENLHKYNGFVKASGGTDASGWSIGLSAYHSRWTSTDQIPERAVQSGRIGRFGFIDEDVGGKTTRIALTGERHVGNTRITAFAEYYKLRLTSNFTYFLEDPVNGDEFQQRDERGVFGGAIEHRFDERVGEIPVAITIGGDVRYDRIGTIGLFRSAGAIPIATIREDKVDEYSGGIYGEAQLTLAPGLRATLGLRGDLYGYDVDAALDVNAGSGSDAIVAPKFALAWSPVHTVELYANYGHSFHSNDVRGASITVDPVTGDPADRVPVLARARGAEIGARFENGRLSASLVGFYLTLASELVFVGDAGATEPNDATRRYGTEATIFWRPTDWLTLDGSASFTHARFRGVAPDFDRIPGSVDEVLAAGAAVEIGKGFSTSLRVRHFGAAPLIEDNSVRSDPTTLINLGGYFTRGSFRLGVDVLNLFDSRDADITYFYPSRLPGEPAGGVDDRHFHPVEPRQVRISLRYGF